MSGTPPRLKFTDFLGEPASTRHETTDDRAAEEANDKGEGRALQPRVVVQADSVIEFIRNVLYETQ